VAALTGRDRPPAISQRFERSGRGYRESEALGINIDALDPGRYLLTVTVVDRAGDQRTQRQAPFIKLEQNAGWLDGGG